MYLKKKCLNFGLILMIFATKLVIYLININIVINYVNILILY